MVSRIRNPDLRSSDYSNTMSATYYDPDELPFYPGTTRHTMGAPTDPETDPESEKIFITARNAIPQNSRGEFSPPGSSMYNPGESSSARHSTFDIQRFSPLRFPENDTPRTDSRAGYVQSMLERTPSPTMFTPLSPDEDDIKRMDDTPLVGFVPLTPEGRLSPTIYPPLSPDDENHTMRLGDPNALLYDLPRGEKIASGGTSGMPHTPVSGTPRSRCQTIMDSGNSLQEMSNLLYAEINRFVFRNRLPPNLRIVWEKRSRTLAGSFRQQTDETGPPEWDIRLSTWLLNTPERVVNTLAHEMCHAAMYILEEDDNHGHGPKWRRWADKIEQIYEGSLTITEKHEYEGTHQYTIYCPACYAEFSRHKVHPNWLSKECPKCPGKKYTMEKLF